MTITNPLPMDPGLQALGGGILAVLVIATVVGEMLARRASSDAARAAIRNLKDRVRAWWVMCAVLALALLTGRTGAALLFMGVSFLALREFVTLAPTRHGDHRALLWIFFVVTPVQYWLVWRDWYGLFAIFIPVFVFLLAPARVALAGDTGDFLARTAVIQWGLMICVYCVSYAPALLMLDANGEGGGAKLLLFLLIVVQGSDVLQYIWGKLLGRRKIAPLVSPNKTWEGFVGGVASATLLGTALWWLTPFAPWQAAVMALVIALMGFAGGLTMSAIKRDRGVKDFGTLIAGHGGILDRIDSLCFAAPVFFHLVRYFFGA
ncbi:MAG: phosphatidate cytidylyltransferase [Thermomicrobiales bacterium]|nr:phosphatidate cytidylyltransferase [Thermomicrobiales bacterium]